MGYLDNTVVTVDAILTKRGRQLLAAGQDEFKITQFALGDDEIDYDMWNPTHPLGSNYYGEVIENMPILEAFPDETQAMRSKLITLPKLSQFIPVVALQPNVSTITLTRTGEVVTITPSTLNLTNGNATLGYTCILSDNTAADLRVASGGEVANTTNTTTFLGDGGSNRSVSLVGTKFELVAKPQQLGTYTTVLTLIGNETGGSVTVTVTINQLNVDVIASNTQS